MKKHKRKSLIPKRRKFAGERTLNDTLRNTARALKWLAPRVATRSYLHHSYEGIYLEAAATLLDCAHEHERHIARRARKKK